MASARLTVRRVTTTCEVASTSGLKNVALRLYRSVNDANHGVVCPLGPLRVTHITSFPPSGGNLVLNRLKLAGSEAVRVVAEGVRFLP
jgi:hypothetical protein